MSTQLQTTLKQHRLSLTAGRMQVFDVLANNEPLTMRELSEHCLGAMDKASVYRTVATFERLGIVQRLQIGWKYKLELSNAFQAHHHHLTCMKCGLMTALPEDPVLEKQLLKLAADNGFTAVDHQLEIKGYCPACQQTQVARA
jgi:Fe2+ or Zn2+ uptake regulation protein